jgi:pyruvate dehydrogenase E2 component (dihydrolipoamide acetyltransferase)
MLGLTMSEGTILHWLRKEGEAVRQGEPLLEVETDKVTLEVEAPASGVLLKILALPGQAVPVGEVVGFVGEPSERMADEPAAPPPRASISPRARRLAEQHGIDWRQIGGSGAAGQVTEEDIRARLAQPAAADALRKPLSRTRQIIAERLSRSQRERVHIYLTISADMTGARRLHAAGFPYDALFLKALAIALTEFPVLNSTLVEVQVQPHASVDIGFALAVDDETLVAPVVRSVERKALDQIAAERRALVAKARARQLTPDEMTGGTFTLSNLGMYGVEQFTAIINPPQTGILAVGAIMDEVRVVNDAVVSVPVVRLTLGVDHRLVDGALAAKFLSRLKGLLEQAGQLHAPELRDDSSKFFSG